MSKNRLEAFSDGVLAIIITIMVLEMKAPEEASFQALKPLVPQLVIYLLSFFYMAIYWEVSGLHGFSHADVVPAGPAGQGMAGKNQ